MAVNDFFVWGQGGSKKTPEQIAREREFADAILARAGDASPVGHWTQGAARVVDALGGVVRQRRADAADAEIADVNKGLISSLLGGGTSSASSGAPIPMSSDGGEISATAPGAVGNVDPSIRSGIVETASALGIDPVDLATAISYETAGTFDPTKAGPTTQWGQHRGLIQFGEPQAKEYGVNWEDPIGSQLGENGAVANYLRATGVQPGMGLLDIYSAINAGGVGRYGASDANNGGAPGTVADKVNDQMAGHRAKALALLGTAPADATQAIEAVAPAAASEVAATAPNAAVANAMLTQVAGGGDRYPTQAANTGINPAIIEALTNPQANEQTQRIASILLQQDQARQNAAMEAEMRNADPLRRLQIEKGQIELDALRNPQPERQPLINAGNGNVYDPNSGQWIQAPEGAGQQFRGATPEEAQRFGAAAGQFGPDGRFYPLNPPQGTSLSVDPATGAVTFNQGAGVKPLTESQSKDTLYATRATNALPLLNQYEDNLMSLPEAAAGAIPFNLGNYAQSQEYQLARDAGRDFLATILRKDTGAAITSQEEDIYGKMFLPQPGDKPATIQAKRQRRALAVEAIKAGMPPTAIENMAKALDSVPASTDLEVPTDIPGVKIRRKN
ncbi:hypothetical protein [Ensifer sp. SL37]|uniref:hypothetical protein n=1 Tax=Ensifer sp. SL37 TaxID=2995137 RepID=UPI002276D8F3|nr:hypothetical protein [Ensifer sp. SL37]MCY1741154.1 hypothetical protein [Ensifer sp. SL37]